MSSMKKEVDGILNGLKSLHFKRIEVDESQNYEDWFKIQHYFDEEIEKLKDEKTGRRSFNTIWESLYRGN